MNRAAEILEFLAQDESPKSVLLAPGAPPVTHAGRTIDVAGDFVLNAYDIADTLDAFRAMSGRMDSTQRGENGHFSFGKGGLGRLRVKFATQRGSKVLKIDLVPFVVPDLDASCAASTSRERLLSVCDGCPSGLLAVTGRRIQDVSRVVYGLLKHLNDAQRRVICIVERRLHYLIAHANSVVVQSEVDVDVATMESGIGNALEFDPDVLFVNDVRSEDTLPSLRHAVGMGVLTIVGSASLTYEAIAAKSGYGDRESDAPSGRLFGGDVRVAPADEGLLNVEFTDRTMAHGLAHGSRGDGNSTDA